MGQTKCVNHSTKNFIGRLKNYKVNLIVSIRKKIPLIGYFFDFLRVSLRKFRGVLEEIRKEFEEKRGVFAFLCGCIA